jgi:hypothetical protein
MGGGIIVQFGTGCPAFLQLSSHSAHKSVQCPSVNGTFAPVRQRACSRIARWEEPKMREFERSGPGSETRRSSSDLMVEMCQFPGGGVLEGWM